MHKCDDLAIPLWLTLIFYEAYNPAFPARRMPFLLEEVDEDS